MLMPWELIRKPAGLLFNAWRSIRKRAVVVLTYLVSIVVAGFVAYQYFDSKWKTRIDRTLQYVLLSQEPEKILARNNLDIELTAEQLEQSTPPYKPGFSLSPETVSEMRDVSDVKEISLPPFAVAERAAKENLAACELYIEEFANKIVTIQHAVKKPDNARHINDLSTKQSIEFGDGKIVTNYGNGDLWWSESGTYYHYSWPYVTWKFFNPRRSEEEDFSELDKYKLDQCVNLVYRYELVLGGNLLGSVHELKHFYAALSICTTSGVCDSYVACEAFNREVSTYLAEWEHYLELWSAKEKKSQYDRLHEFVRHCWSNHLFFSNSSLNDWDHWYDPAIFYAQQFTNLWWRFEREEGDWF